MKKLLLAILFLPSFAFSQSTTICEQDFNTTGSLPCSPTTKNTIPSVFTSINNNSLCFSQPAMIPLNIPGNYLLGISGALSYSTNTSLSQYDSVAFDFDIKVNNHSGGQNFGNNYVNFQGAIPQPFQYLDPATSKSFFDMLMIRTSIPIYSAGKLRYTNINNVGHMRVSFSLNDIPNSNDITIFTWSKAIDLSGSFLSNSACHIGSGTQAIDCFCNTTTNPTDCKTKLSTSSINDMQDICYDNFKITGIKNDVLTALEAESIGTKDKTLLATYDLLGNKIDDRANHEGIVIKYFSDGSRSKEYLQN